MEGPPQLRPQMYFKSSLTALSHAMEDQVLAGEDQPLVIACFQRERFYRQEAHRYLRIAERSPQVYVLSTPETEFKNASGPYETIAFEPGDALSQEWHLVVIGQKYSVCLVSREHQTTTPQKKLSVAHMDQARRFEGIWTFERRLSCRAAHLLLARICQYRPELSAKVAQAQAQIDPAETIGVMQVDPAPFADRLVTYLQAGQYRQQKAYRQIALQERQERLVNSMTAAIRRSLDPDQVLGVAVQELGQALDCDRCLIYRCQDTDKTTTLQFEFTVADQTSLVGQTWLLQQNPWFQSVVQQREWLYLEDVNVETHDSNKLLNRQLEIAQLRSLLMVPVLYQGRLLGMVELHQCVGTAEVQPWGEVDVALVEAIATQVGVALIQAQSFADLESLNHQLEALEQARSNLIAITGHELRTPLSTVQICLESLLNEPDMPAELEQVMLTTAISDAERMRNLIQDFLNLSRIESGRVEWNPEALILDECVDLALSGIHIRQAANQLPRIQVNLPATLPLVRADGEWLVEVLTKLLDNACKFTGRDGAVTIQAKPRNGQMLEVIVSDTGRGIEPDLLDVVFERFYQEEGALRRTTGGTGLGLAICRQIIHNLGGQIWAKSPGKNQGSAFHFTIPTIQEITPSKPKSTARRSTRKPQVATAATRKPRSKGKR